MLLVFKIPIADIRSFFKDSKETKIHSKNNEFIRGFGKFGDVSHRFIDYEKKMRELWRDNNKYMYYTAKRGLRLVFKDEKGEKQQIHKNLFCEEGIYDFRVAFRHFCFLKKIDDDTIGHFAIGFFLEFPNNMIDIQQICKACSIIAKMETQQYRVDQLQDSSMKTKSVFNALIDSSQTIANYFCASTTRTMENSARIKQGQDPYTYKNYVSAGTPVFMATLKDNEYLKLPKGGSRLGYPDKFTLSYGEVPVQGGKTVKLFVLKKNRQKSLDHYRELISSLSIVHDEYQGMALIKNLMQKNNALSKPYCDELADFQTLSPLIKKNVEHALKKINKNSKAFDIIDFLESDEKYDYKSLLESMKSIDKKISDKKEAFEKEKKRQEAIDMEKAKSGGNTINNIYGNNNTIAQSFGEGTIAAINSTISTIQNNELRKELEKLSKKIEEIKYPGEFPDGLKDDITTTLKQLIENVSSDKLSETKKNDIKTWGQRILGWANSTAAFLKPVADIVVAACKVIGIVFPDT